MTRAKRRSFQSYIVEPFQQIRFGLHVVTVSLTFVFVFAWLVLSSFKEQYSQVAEIFQVVETGALVTNDIFIKNSIILGASLLIFITTMMVVVLRRTHKMYGPMVSIMRFLAELEKGNYAVRIHVRERDDFRSIVGKMNELAESLHRRHGAPSDSEDASSNNMDALDTRLRDLEDGVVVVSHPPSKAS